MSEPRLLLATGNAGKLREYRRLLSGAGVTLLSPADVGLDLAVEEDGRTFLANSQKKAREYLAASGIPTLADDSGLVVNALGGAPGVDSAHYGGPDLDDAGRWQLVLDQMDAVADRRASFICVLTLARPLRPLRDVFVGRCHGRIGREARGRRGFGYDPIFVFDDGRTMGELDDEEKDARSHRGAAVREMLRSISLPAWVSG